MIPLATEAAEEKIFCFVLFLSISLEQDGGRGGNWGREEKEELGRKNIRI